jgi:hypothetical protein
MANLLVLNGDGDEKYLKQSGAGTDVDPHIGEHLETNSANILTAAQAIQAADEAVQVILEAVASDSELQVDIVSSALPTGASTAALQTSSEALLTTIDADTSAIVTDAAAIEVLLTTIEGNQLADGHNVTVDNASIAVTGTVAANAGTNLNTSALALEAGGNLAAIATDAAAIEVLLGTIDTDTSALADTVDDGQVQVDIVAALPAGTNAIGKLAANSGVDIGDVDVASIAAGENLIGLVGSSDMVVTITPTLAAEAHSAGDLLFDSTEIAEAVRANGGTAIVQSIFIADKGDQKPAMTLMFANAETDFGAPGGVPDPDDTDILTGIGQVVVSADDYVDWGANSTQQVPSSKLGFLVKAGAATTSIYLAAMATGTPTPASTSDLQITIGLLRS